MKTLTALVLALGLLAGCVVHEDPSYRDRGASRGDRDRDGVPNRVDRDRDNDGVPNRDDRRPNDPRRY